jgi:hypothetical protein
MPLTDWHSTESVWHTYPPYWDVMSGVATHEFVWPLEATSARVTGSFCGWGDGYALNPRADGKFSVVAEVPTGAKHFYKYVVDGTLALPAIVIRANHVNRSCHARLSVFLVGKWVYDPTQPFLTDQYGDMNNVLFVDPVTGEEIDKSMDSTFEIGDRVSPSEFVEPQPMPSEALTDTPSQVSLMADLDSPVVSDDHNSGTVTESPVVEGPVATTADIAEWLETANGFCAPVVRRRQSITPTELAANRELLSEFMLEVAHRKTGGMVRSVSSASLSMTPAGLLGYGVDAATDSVEKLTVAQASVRKEGKLVR